MDDHTGLADLLQEIKTTRENLTRTDEQRLAALNDIKSEQERQRASLDELYRLPRRSHLAKAGFAPLPAGYRTLGLGRLAIKAHAEAKAGYHLPR
jgi:hypothetical protein